MNATKNRSKLSVAKVLPLIDEYSGNISVIARKLAVERNTVYRLIEKNQTLKDALSSSREKMLDNVESSLYSKALDGDTACMIFFLKTQGRSRGYTEKAEISGPDGGPITIRVEYEDYQVDPSEAA